MGKEEQPLIAPPQPREVIVYEPERPRVGVLRRIFRVVAGFFVLIFAWSLIHGCVKHTRFNSGVRHPFPSSLLNAEPALTPSQMSSGRPAPAGQCGPESFSLLSKTYSIKTGDRDVNVIQRVKPDHGHDHDHDHYVRVRGTIDVRPASEARIDLDISGNNEDIPVDVTFEENQKLTITTSDAPQHGDHHHHYPCVEVKVVVHLPEATILDRLSLHAVSLDTTLHDGLSLSLDSASLGTVASDIQVQQGAIASVRDLALNSVSGDIDAVVPLSETIHQETTSGEIKLTILPVEKPSFKRASLTVASVSGDIDVRAKGEPAHIHYDTKVHSISGEVAASLPFSDADLGSKSGEITALLTPVSASSLRTSSLSGEVDLTVREPAAGSLKDIGSQHESASGDLKIRYPSAWEGEFSATTFSGRVKVKGKDVDVRGMKRSVTGSKGDGKSLLRAKSFSGDIKIVIGEA